MKVGLTKQIRQALKPGQVFGVGDLVLALNIQSYADVQRVRTVIHDLKKVKEIRSVSRGVYEYQPKERPRGLLDVVWHLVRSHRLFDADEIERLSGANRYTVLEYLRCLVGYGYLVKPNRRHWKLINDPGPETPVNTGKCARLKARRGKGIGL